MVIQPSPFVLPLVLMAVLSLWSTVYVLRHGPVPGALSYAALCLGAAWYALCFAMELASVGLEQKVLWSRLMFIGIVTGPAGLLGFAGVYTERPAWLRWQTHLLLAVEPLIVQILLWTNDAHHLIWTRVWLQTYYASFTQLGVSYGPGFWVHMAYTYGVTLLAVTMLALAFSRSSYVHRRQTAIVLGSTALLGLSRVLVVTGWNPIAPIDPTPFGAGLAAILGAWGLWHYRTFDLLPVARSQVMERMGEGIVVVNAAGRIVDVNAAVVRLLEQQPAQVVGQAAASVLPFYDELVRRYPGEVDVHEEIERAVGERRRYFDVHMSALHEMGGRVGGYLFVLRDVTERRAAEEQVQQRSQELSTLYDTVLEVASRLDLAELLPTLVERAAVLLRATGCGIYLYRPAQDRLEYVAACGIAQPFIAHTLRRGEGVSGRVLESGQPVAVDDYHHWAGRSAKFDRQELGAVLGVPIKWGERVLGVIDLGRDPGATFTPDDIHLLTLFANQAAIVLANAQLYEAAQCELAERKRTEEQLRESERRYRAVIEDQTELIARSTPDGRVSFANEAMCRFWGMEREQAIGRSILADVPPEDQAQVMASFASITPEYPVHSNENRVTNGNGQVHWFQWTDRGIFDEQGRLIEYQSVGRDISERKRAEEEREKLQAQLQQVQRMEAVGVLAGGVAHEFNNLLTVIQGNVELAMADLDANHPVRASLAAVARTAQRAAALTRQLLAFSRRQVLERKEVDLNKLITDLSPMLQHGLGPDVQVQFDPAPECKAVLADSGAVEQVLMNLVLNARDAMPQGGKLHITTAPATLDEGFCRTCGDIKPGEYVRLTVADTGVGIDEDSLSHLFEPFFTTKEVGKGTGLGLSMAYGIVRQHEGLIQVHSQVGQGTQFDVYLPVYDNH